MHWPCGHIGKANNIVLDGGGSLQKLLIILRFYNIRGDQEQGKGHGWLVVCHMGIIQTLKCCFGLYGHMHL